MDRINGADTVDIGSGRRGFRDENLVAGVTGTEVTADFLNAIQEEIIKIVTEAGLDPSASDWTQLWQALQVHGLSTANRSRQWLAVTSMTVSSPPASPASGDTYLIPSGASDAWSANVGKIAQWTGSAWSYLTPPDGHGISLPDGRVFERISGAYVEFLASRDWASSRTAAVTKLGRLPWLPVLSMTLSSAPGSPAVGDTYLIPSGATGVWAANVGKIAEYTDASWSYLTPPDGHGISLPDGRFFERISGAYVEKLALDTQSGKWNYAIAAGTADALTATFSPAITASTLRDGMTLTLRTSLANTSSTVTVDVGTGQIGIIRGDTSALAIGDIAAGGTSQIEYDATLNKWKLLNPTGASRGVLLVYSVAGTYSWTCPAGVTRLKAIVTGGGGGAGGSTSSITYAGGNAGATAIKYVNVVPGTSYTVIVGDGGAGGATGASGSNGGSSSAFGMSAVGGLGSSTGTKLASNATGGDINIAGGEGVDGPGASVSFTPPINGGASFWGGGPSGGGTSANASVYGAGGAPVVGGAGTGGAGAVGIVVLEY